MIRQALIVAALVIFAGLVGSSFAKQAAGRATQTIAQFLDKAAR